ncbi:hypothetical protein M0802_009411 [Mischocyttarus mexicanus]|nr:hypothetical protein M0802_009411 [Mischocyttarus mexicanus]
MLLLNKFSDGRILELHSPDGVHECWLRAADNTEANVWFNALHSALAALTLKALRLASAVPDPPQLQHIGWLARRHCLQNDDDDDNDDDYDDDDDDNDDNDDDYRLISLIRYRNHC